MSGKFILKNVLLILVLFMTPFSIYSQTKTKGAAKTNKTKRIFKKKFETKQGITPKLAEEFRDKLILYYFEEGAGKYRVLSESDVKIMYQQAEELLKTGCDVEKCLMEIAYAVNADIIIYGKMEKKEGKIRVFSQSLIRNIKTDELTKGSIVDVEFYESQLDWFAKEIVKKMINPRHYIDVKKAPTDIRVDVVPEKIGLKGPAKISTIKLLKFKTDDDAVQIIVDVLKGIVSAGDVLYNKSEYSEAREKYKEVINKIETKLIVKKQQKLTTFKSDIDKRIVSTYKMEFNKALKRGDEQVKEKYYSSAKGTYNGIKDTIEYLEKKIKAKLLDYKVIVNNALIL